jgi:hypothetical protein
MLWVPQKGVLRTQSNFSGVGTLSMGTAVTTGAASGTKGTAVELIASTNFDAFLVEVYSSDYGLSATNAAGCLDILIGAATESVLIPNLLMGNSGGKSSVSKGPKRWLFPLYIPAGSRLAAQAAGARVSTASRVGIKLWGGAGYPPFKVGTKVTTYGVGAVPNGTAVTVGASGAEGSWTQITASTSYDHFAIFPSLQTTDTTLSNSMIELDVGVGSATESLLDSWNFWADSQNEIVEGPMNALPWFGDVPAGTRLAVRGSQSSAADSWQVALHGVT